MPYHDLNVPWTNGSSMESTVTFLTELGYNVVALSYLITGSLQGDLKSQIPQTLPFKTSSRTRILRRCTLVVSDPSQNYRIPVLAANNDILALRPTNEKSLMFACSSQDCDIISIDLTQRMDYYPKMKTLSSAIERGITIELCYAPAVLAVDAHIRRNVISNATQLIRATRGRGIIISSESPRAAGCRGPEDVINLAAVWGLGQERGKEALDKLARSTVVNAHLRRASFKGVVTVIHGGEASVNQNTETPGNTDSRQKKRKADKPVAAEGNVMPLSKREQKRRRKAEEMQDA